MGIVCSINRSSSEKDASGNSGSGGIVPSRKDLIFPNEILEKIGSFLSSRDKLVAREVCMAWMNYINVAGGLEELVTVNVCSDELNYLVNTNYPVFTRFHFHKVDLTRQSTNFWNLYSDIITHLDFYDCSVIPRNTCDSNQAEFSLGCPNLKHLGLVNCDKYFLMGGKFIQLSEILCLENLQSLNLSRNKNLTDYILFSILLKTNKLQSLDLSDCLNMVYMKAVHSRFYPNSPGDADEDVNFSDHILSFHTLCIHFLSTDRARHMKEFNFGMKLNSTGMNLIVSSENNVQWERANLESPELKASDLKTFICKYRSSLCSVKLGRCKLTSEEIQSVSLKELQEFEVYDSHSINSLVFLTDLTNLRKLRLDGLKGFEVQCNDFGNFRNLSELSLNGIKPVGDPDECRQELLKIFKHLRTLKVLDIGNAPLIVNDELVQGVIAFLQCLKSLNLESSNITDFGLTGVRPSDNLQDLDHSSAEQHSLMKLSDMEHLDLNCCRELGDLSWQKAIKFRNLVSLNLSTCTLSKKGILSIIRDCRNIEKLILVHCSRQILTDSDVLLEAREKLYRCKGITY